MANRLDVFMLVLVVGLVLLPKILTNRGILVGLVDRFGGLAPLKVDFERVRQDGSSRSAFKVLR